MLELYGSADPATLKLAICLEELQQPFEFHRLELKALAQWAPAHRRMAPQGEVPVLVDGSRTLTDATMALLYLAESHPRSNLVPADPVQRYDAYALSNIFDAALLASVNTIGWHRQNDAAARTAYDQALARIPDRQQLAGWSAVWRDAEADRLKRAEDRITAGIARIERTLGSRHWLVGEQFSLADINAFALVEGVAALLPRALDAPQVSAWVARMHARPGVVRALAGPVRGGAGPVFAPA